MAIIPPPAALISLLIFHKTARTTTIKKANKIKRTG